MNSETGKTFLIIGGTTGLGLSAAKALVANGHKVAILGRNRENLDSALKSLGNNAIGITGDATKSNGVDSILEHAVQHWGSIDGLYHVAGGSGRAKGDGPAHEISDEGLDYTLNLNLKSLIISNRAAIRQLLKQGTGGVILNMGSVLGFSPSPKHFSTHTYAATKAAVVGFTKSVAATYAKENIRANVIAPALVETPMAKRAASDAEILKYITTKQPLAGGRIGTPSDLDGAVVYFLTGTSQFVTGQVLAVDGGWMISEGQYH
ncbi:MAG: SDR family oxidoreductase [Opitutae bacterium]|nr:SDR family oxidoreductase [Opitutae bacterium]